jgi:hypothetical protein
MRQGDREGRGRQARLWQMERAVDRREQCTDVHWHISILRSLKTLKIPEST